MRAGHSGNQRGPAHVTIGGRHYLRTAANGLLAVSLRPNPLAKRVRKAQPPSRQNAFVDTRVIYYGDNLDQLRKLPDKCVDLIYIDPPFNSNRNYEVF
jgi:predicted methyltransferase